MRSAPKTYWLCYFLFALAGLVLAPSISYLLLGPGHLDGPVYLVGTILTTIGLLFVKIKTNNYYQLVLVCIIGFFSFLSIFFIGMLLTLIVRIRTSL